MRARYVVVEADTSARPEDVYALLVDGSTWPQWSPLTKVVTEGPERVGAVRVNERGRTVGRDELTELVPARLFAYRSIAGLPVKDYRALVVLDTRATGTHITWRADFTPKYLGSGSLLERGIGKFLRQCAEGLAQHAALDRPFAE